MSLSNGQYRVPAFTIQKLTDTGFETAGVTTNFNADYSVTSEDAFIQTFPGLILRIDAIVIAITDSGTFAESDYGNIVGGLTNGLQTVVEINGVEITNAEATISSNSELFTVDSQAQIVQYSANDRTLVARFNLSSPVILNGNTADKFILRLSDDMTGLTIHEFVAIGNL